jgi:hypothetical protein
VRCVGKSLPGCGPALVHRGDHGRSAPRDRFPEAETVRRGPLLVCIADIGSVKTGGFVIREPREVVGLGP